MASSRPPRNPEHLPGLRFRSERHAEYEYADEFLLRERRNLARRWWGTFWPFYSILVVLIALGWLRVGVQDFGNPIFILITLAWLGAPVASAAVGFCIWWLWIALRPIAIQHFIYSGKPKSAFRIALAALAELGWTPWEINYEHQVVDALVPERIFAGIPPQVVTIFCEPINPTNTEIRVQSRFIEATRVRDASRVHRNNTQVFQNAYRRLASDADRLDLPSPHPLARFRGRLPEEQELAIQALGRARARARLWAVWVFITVLAFTILFLQPYGNDYGVEAVAWPLSFLAAGLYHFVLGNMWNRQEHAALRNATVTIIANPFKSQEALWTRIDELTKSQRLRLEETLDEHTRLYREQQPAPGYPGTYILLSAGMNDAGIEQLIAVGVPEWGVLTALLPSTYAAHAVLALMQGLRDVEGVKKPVVIPEPPVIRHAEVF